MLDERHVNRIEVREGFGEPRASLSGLFRNGVDEIKYAVNI